MHEISQYLYLLENIKCHFFFQPDNYLVYMFIGLMNKARDIITKCLAMVVKLL